MPATAQQRARLKKTHVASGPTMRGGLIGVILLATLAITLEPAIFSAGGGRGGQDPYDADKSVVGGGYTVTNAEVGVAGGAYELIAFDANPSAVVIESARPVGVVNAVTHASIVTARSGLFGAEATGDVSHWRQRRWRPVAGVHPHAEALEGVSTRMTAVIRLAVTVRPVTRGRASLAAIVLRYRYRGTAFTRRIPFTDVFVAP